MITDFGKITLGQYSFVNAAAKAEAAYGTTKPSTIASPFGPQLKENDEATNVKDSFDASRKLQAGDDIQSAISRTGGPIGGFTQAQMDAFKGNIVAFKKAEGNGDPSTKDADGIKKIMANMPKAPGTPTLTTGNESEQSKVIQLHPELADVVNK